MKGIQNTSTENYSTIIGNNKMFMVPKFQREYSWGSEQWDDLWQDIETMRSEKDDHYMGYLVLQTADDKNYQIIDGQQRFTTVTILILAAIPSRIEVLEEKWAKLTDNIKTEKLPEFLRYYWNVGHKSIRANALFKTIRKEVVTDQQVFLLVDDLYRYSDVYMALTDSNDIGVPFGQYLFVGEKTESANQE